MKCINILFVVLFLASLNSCKKDEPSGGAVYEDGEELSAGSATVNDRSSLAFGYQVPALSSQQSLDFFVGNSFFTQNWVEAPSSTTARDGLGPLFNARSCASCHFRDGRGEPFATKGILFRLSTPGTGAHGEPLPDINYGGQFQDYSISNIAEEGTFSIAYTETAGSFPDGEAYSLRKPQYTFDNPAYGNFSGGIMHSPRIGQQIIGLGLIENIDETAITAHTDEADADADGVSGKANYVFDPITQTTMLGRFGWKANVANLYHQTAGALSGDIGITSWLFPDAGCTSAQQDCANAINGGTPEIDDSDLDKLVLYTRTLAVPVRRNYEDEDVLKGKTIFREAGCAKCHTEQFQTSANSSISALNNITVRPYSDFLLHDMGAELADNRPDFLASGTEWRTQPLWGLGLIETVNNHTYLLHDGRARNITEAILWHGGEAESARNYFHQLSQTERKALLRFLESL